MRPWKFKPPYRPNRQLVKRVQEELKARKSQCPACGKTMFTTDTLVLHQGTYYHLACVQYKFRNRKEGK